MAENELREQLGQAFLDGEFNEVLSELLNKYEISPSDCRYYFVKNFDDEINLHSFFIKDLKYAKSINNENLNRYLSGFDSVRVNLDSNKESVALGRVSRISPCICMVSSLAIILLT